MKTIQAPGIFIAQFISDKYPFNTLETIAAWAAALGYKALQIPTWDSRVFDLALAAESTGYCDDLRGKLAEHGLVVSELSTHLQGQLIAVHPAYDSLFDAFAPREVHGDSKARTEWAKGQLRMAAKASSNLGLSAHATFSGALAWPFFYPWPQRSQGLIEEAFFELAERWQPLLQIFDEQGVDVCYELHPGEDLHDGISFERFLEATSHHPRVRILYDPSHQVLQQMDYLTFIDIYHDYIRAFHVKDAEYRPTGRSGVYAGYQDWIDRPGRFRSLGDGQVDFAAVFSKFAKYDYAGWAVLEWEDCIKNGEDGAREGAIFIEKHRIQVADRAFDDFAGTTTDAAFNRKLLGLH